MSEPFKIAVINTTFYLRSHADVIATRWTQSRPADKDWGWSGPSSQLASIYIEQIGEKDTGVAWARDNHVPLMPDIKQAITLGQDRIAVDGVLLIGEHGEYPQNEFGQKTYPRKELFDKIVQVFVEYGKSVPVFCDKHYSWNAKWAHEMVQTAAAMNFPLLGGSSIPHTPFVPHPNLANGFKPTKAVAIYYGDKEAYLYHSLEFAQSVLEKRAGGESGIKAITTYAGKDAWPVLTERFGDELLQAAVATSRNTTPGSMVDNCAAGCNEATGRISPMLTILHYADGLEVAHVNLNGHIKGWEMAIQTQDGVIHPFGSTASGEEIWFAHFATFSKLVETFLKTGQYPFAPQRALFTTCATAAAMHSLQQPGVRYESPLTMIPYQPLKDVKYHPQAR